MKRRIFLALPLLLGLAASLDVQAQARWRDLPPEDRRQMRQQMRDHWQQEREFRREEGPGRGWQDVPSEDRRRLREDLREQRQWERGERGERYERGWPPPPRRD